MAEESIGNDCGFVDITDNQDGGVLKCVLKPGNGSEFPGTNSKVSVYYVGTLLNNEKFDSCTEGEPFKFKLGCGEVIKAWDICVATMSRGEKCSVKCRADYAYGEKGSPPKIGPNETLVFEIELIDWEENYLTEDKGVSYKVIKKGLQTGSPSFGSRVKIFYRGFIDDNMFHESEISFTLCDDGLTVGIPLGLELAISKMCLHEKALVTISSEYGYGAKGKLDWDVPPHAQIVVEVYLEEFKAVKESWEMTIGEKLTAARRVKEFGNISMKDCDYLYAEYFYKSGESFLQNIWDEKEKASAESVHSAIRMNLALCYIKMRRFASALEQSEKVLETDPRNVKALYRKGQALLSLKKFKHALESIELLQEIEPSNMAAKSLRALCAEGIKEIEAKESMIYQNAFKKIASAHPKIN